MSIEEQARAEAEKRWPEDTFDHAVARQACVEVFLAGHEAATRTRVVSTVTELDALPEEAVIRDSNRMVFERWRRWEAVGGAPVDPVLPARVLYDPEETR